MMAVMVMLYTTVLSTKMKNADGRSGHGGGEAEGQWILYFLQEIPIRTESMLRRRAAFQEFHMPSQSETEEGPLRVCLA